MKKKTFCILFIYVIFLTGCTVNANEENIIVQTDFYTFTLPSTWENEYVTTLIYNQSTENGNDGSYTINFYEKRDYDGENGGFLGSIELLSCEEALKVYGVEEYYWESRQYIGVLRFDTEIYHMQMGISRGGFCTEENLDLYTKMLEEMKQVIPDSISAKDGYTFERKRDLRENTIGEYINGAKIYFPVSWENQYEYNIDYVDGGWILNIYEKTGRAENMGYLFGLGEFFKQEDYMIYYEPEYIGELYREYPMDTYTHIVLLSSAKEEYNEKNKEMYLQMQKDIPLVLSMIEWNNYNASWVTDETIDSNYEDIPIVDAWSNYLGNTFSGSYVAGGSMPALYGLMQTDGVMYCWDAESYSGQRWIGLRDNVIVAYADWVESSSIYNSVTVGSLLASDVVWPEPKCIEAQGMKYFVWKLLNGYTIIGAYNTSEDFRACEAVVEVHVSEKGMCKWLSDDIEQQLADEQRIREEQQRAEKEAEDLKNQELLEKTLALNNVAAQNDETGYFVTIVEADTETMIVQFGKNNVVESTVKYRIVESGFYEDQIYYYVVNDLEEVFSGEMYSHEYTEGYIYIGGQSIRLENFGYPIGEMNETLYGDVIYQRLD